jgi:hypothetical protein
MWVMTGGVPGPRHGWILLAVLAALSLTFGLLSLWAFIRIKSEGRALVLDNRGVEFRPIRGRPAQIPWDQVIRVREKVEHTGEEGERYVVLDLRAPLSTFLVPAKEKDRRGRLRAREGKLSLQTRLLDIPKDDLIRLIQAHLSEADTTPDATVRASLP